jgi:hypothetical protein
MYISFFYYCIFLGLLCIFFLFFTCIHVLFITWYTKPVFRVMFVFLPLHDFLHFFSFFPATASSDLSMNSTVAAGRRSYCCHHLLFYSGCSSAAAASSIGSTTTAGLHRLPSLGTGSTGGTGLHCHCIKQLLCHRHFLLGWIRIDSICCHHRADFIRCSVLAPSVLSYVDRSVDPARLRSGALARLGSVAPARLLCNFG